MFDEVLKRGSLIVDGLSAYKSPAFVYIVPNGELRGGAWVVLDPSINKDGMMEMYADETSRAGVLEPEGIVEIKLRKDKILAMMDRLDDTYRSLKLQSVDPSLSPADSAAAKTALVAREKVLMPLYNQIALQFAQLHDTPNRMKAKGAIRDSLVWTESRKYFYWRLRRRLQEEAASKKLAVADPSLSRAARLELVTAALNNDSLDLENDQAVTLALEACESAIALQAKKVRASAIGESILSMSNEDHAAVVDGLKRVLGGRLDADGLATMSRLLSQ